MVMSVLYDYLLVCSHVWFHCGLYLHDLVINFVLCMFPCVRVCCELYSHGPSQVANTIYQYLHADIVNLDSSRKPNSSRVHGVLKEEAKAAEITFQKVLSPFWECHNTYSRAKTMTDAKVTHFSTYTTGCGVLQLNVNDWNYHYITLHVSVLIKFQSITKVHPGCIHGPDIGSTWLAGCWIYP